MTWQETAKKKHDSIAALIPKEWRIDVKLPSADEQKDITGPFIQKFLNAREIEITETDATGIASKTTTGKWKAKEVILAFAHRAAVAHQLTSCLLEIFFDAAIKDAEQLDEYFAAHGKPVGPLHGVPVSLKDQFHVRGVETSMAYVGWIGTFEGQKGTGREHVYESELVTILRASGAVLYCKTTVPPSLMSPETNNNINGYLYNPKNRHLAAGGSSGGEGALISLRGSPIGFGTDIGGSIRIPASFNGLYGLRPSSGRLPYHGMANSLDGQSSVVSVVGPLATSLSGLRLATKAVLSKSPWLVDPLVHEIPWRIDQGMIANELTSQGGKLAFGVLRDDGIATPHPPITRAMNQVIDALKAKGHAIVEWTPPDHSEGMDILMDVFGFDGGRDIFGSLGLSGEPPIPSMRIIYEGVRPEASATEISSVNRRKRSYQKAYLDYWNSTIAQTGTGRPVDALIMPVCFAAAPRPNTYKVLSYTSIINALDYSACAFPVTTVDKSVDKWEKVPEPHSETDKMLIETYDPEVYDGAYVGLQLVGRRLQEERVISLTEYVVDCLEGRR